MTTTMTVRGMEVERLSCAETAKLIRAALKRSFPGVKFSVKSHTYAGGASIDVSWADGPLTRDVQKVTGKYSGADFDGMIDLKTHNRHWLTEDGQSWLAHAEGTEGSRGSIPERFGDPVPGARLVSFGADYIFCSREMSEEMKAELIAHLESLTHRPYDAQGRYPEFNRPGQEVLWVLFRKEDF